MQFMSRVKIVDGFYKGRRGRLVEQGASKYLVRIRIGWLRLRHVDAWVDQYLVKAI